MDDSDWWKSNPSPYHPDWGLHDLSDLDHSKLKGIVKDDDNTDSEIEALIYQAFLAHPKVTDKLLNQDRGKPSEALLFLQKADETIGTLYGQKEEAKIGYRIIINTMRMWLTNDRSQKKEHETKLKTLESKKTQFPMYVSYAHALNAYILSRLGPRYRCKTISLYKDALFHFPLNYQWMFGLALMVGREARHHRVIVDAWKSHLLPKEITKLFEEEEKLLQKVLELKPSFHLARAYYGQVLFNLGKSPETVWEVLEKALKGSPENGDICLIAAKFRRLQGPFQYAENMLKELLKKFNIAEVHFQLGCLYRWEFRKRQSNHRDAMTRSSPNTEGCNNANEALKCFTQATKMDMSHYAATASCAEMKAVLGETQDALNMYHDLFDNFKDKPYLASEEFISLRYALRMTDFFPPLEYIELLHRIIELAVMLTDDITSNGDKMEHIQLSQKSLDKQKKTYLEEMKLFIKNNDLDVNCEVTLKYANANMLLEIFDEAIMLYKSLYDDIGSSDDGIKISNEQQIEIIFSLGKCYFRKGQKAQKDGDNYMVSKHWKAAIEMAVKLAQKSSVAYSDELYADVYLAKAKALYPSLSEFKERRHSTANPLERAIQKGSLEGCYLYMLALTDLKKTFFLEYAIPRTLVEIQRVCEMKAPFHTQFPATVENGLEYVIDVAAKRDFIRGALKEVLEHDVFAEATFWNESLSIMRDQFKELRKKRLQYEMQLLQSWKTNDFGGIYRNTLFPVVECARKILDNCVAVCQNVLMTQPPNNSMFAVKFDLEEAKSNKKDCKKLITTWADKHTFRGAQLPHGFLEKIEKIQPMYHRKNLWLWAIHSYKNMENHNPARINMNGEKFIIQLGKKSNSTFRSLKTGYMVKKSCAGVETITKELIQMCSDFLDARRRIEFRVLKDISFTCRHLSTLSNHISAEEACGLHINTASRRVANNSTILDQYWLPFYKMSSNGKSVGCSWMKNPSYLTRDQRYHEPPTCW